MFYRLLAHNSTGLTRSCKLYTSPKPLRSQGVYFRSGSRIQGIGLPYYSPPPPLLGKAAESCILPELWYARFSNAQPVGTLSYHTRHMASAASADLVCTYTVSFPENGILL